MPSPEPDPTPCFYVPHKIHTALVLGSGGVRGMAHIGVIEELEKAGIAVDLIVGCSAGSIVGALYCDNPHVEEIKCAVWQLRTHSLMDIDLLNCRYGLSQGKSMKCILSKTLQARTFEELKIPLVVVASDLYSGELVPICSGDLINAVQASSSMPFFFVPIEHRGRVLVDGGVVNTIPVKVARDLGAQVVIAVDLCELLPKTFPTNLFEVVTRSAEIASMWQNDSCSNGANITIRPRTCGVGAFNDRFKQRIYHAGKVAAREKIPLIQELLVKIPREECLNDDWRLVNLRCYTPQIYHEPNYE